MERDIKTYLIKDILETYLSKNRYIGYRIKSEEALRLWRKVVDDYIGLHTDAVLVKEGILYVHTDSSVLANELSLREKELLQKLNDVLKSPVIKGIVFKSGFIRKEKKKSVLDIKSQKEVGIESLKKINRLVKSIKEKELRGILKKLFITAAKRNTKET